MGPIFAYAADKGKAPETERLLLAILGTDMAFEIFQRESVRTNEQLVTRRLEAVKAEDASVHVGEEEGRGSASVVYNCTAGGDTAPKILKVSTMTDGISESEVAALERMKGARGIPGLIQAYEEDGATVALLLEKIEGPLVPAYIAAHKDRAADILMKIHALIEAFHARGMHMPNDWRKEDNWRVSEAGQPYLLDLGEPRRMQASREEREQRIRNDLRTFHTLVEQHLKDLDKKGRKALDRVIYNDYLAYKPDY